MATIGRLWAGRAFGTNTGNLFVQLTEIEGEITGSLRFSDDRFGLSIHAVAGSFDGTVLHLSGTATNVPDGVEIGDLRVEANIMPSGSLKGEWSTTLGAAGTFELFPHDAQSTSAARAAGLPEQIHTATATLGALRLKADDLRALVAIIQSEFSVGRAAVTYAEKGPAIMKFADDFLASTDGLQELREVTIQIQEPDAFGVMRHVKVQLSTVGTNEISVQGVQETWVLGKVQAIETFLRRKQSLIATTYRRFGLTLNAILFFVFLAVLPLVEATSQRVGFALFALAGLSALSWAHGKMMPNATVQFGDSDPWWRKPFWAATLTVLLSVLATIIGGVVLYRLNMN